MFLETLYTSMANWALVIVSLLAFLVFGRQLLAADREFRRSKDPSVVKLELAGRKDVFTDILKTWIRSKGETAVPALRRQLWYDNFWAVTYAVLLSGLIAALTFQPDQQPHWLVLLLFALPLLAGFLDIFFENSLYLLLLRDVKSIEQVNRLPAFPILVASIAARIKFLLVGIAIAGIILILLYRFAGALPSLQSVYVTMSNWLVVLISFLMLILYAAVLFPEANRQYRGKTDPQLPALQLAFSKERFTRVLGAWHKSRGPAAIPAFRRSIIQLDFLFPIIYAMFLSGAIAILTYEPGLEPGQGALLLFLLPFLAAIFDWIENLLHLRILKGVDSWGEIAAVRPSPIFMASVATSLKWALVLASSLAIVVLFLIRLAESLGG